MKIVTVDGINTLLLLASAAVAFFFPFEVFLFSYAFFGPLHYLTEITWLERKDFFVLSKKYVWFLVAVGTLLFAMNIGLVVMWSADAVLTVTALLVALSFLAAFLFIKKWTKGQRIIISLVIALILLFTYLVQAWAIFFAVLLPTIIHVSVFTVLFMLQGAERNGSVVGYCNVGLYFVVSLLLVVLTIKSDTYSLSTYVTDAYRSFEGVNLEIMNLLNIGNPDIRWSIYESAAGLSIMRFLAFAYTYHYLNWFSKVNVINWHKMQKSKMFFIVAVWASAVALYISNYQVGLFMLYFLSLMHVLLEFPLNHQSVVGIAAKIRQRIWS
jgi:hypothetical protein